MQRHTKAIIDSIDRTRVAFEVKEFGQARKDGRRAAFQNAKTQSKWRDFFWSQQERKDPYNRLGADHAANNNN